MTKTNEEKQAIVAELISTPEGRKRIMDVCADDPNALLRAVHKSQLGLVLEMMRDYLTACPEDIELVVAEAKDCAPLVGLHPTDTFYTDADEWMAACHAQPGHALAKEDVANGAVGYVVYTFNVVDPDEQVAGHFIKIRALARCPHWAERLATPQQRRDMCAELNA